MKQIPKLLAYLKPYGKMIAMYVVFILLSTVFSLFTFSMIAPVLQVLFMDEKLSFGNGNGFVGKVSNSVNDFVLQHDKMTALLYAVGIVVLATVLKNGFLYLSQYVLNPLKNTVLKKLREDLYKKTISLPIGFFTEEHKGDLVSKMTNDVNEVENSIVSVLETVIREPITIILTLITMLIVSPGMTLFMLLFLPIAGFVIGRVSRTLKKPSNLAQEQLGKLMTNLDETISGIRVVKAFNAEQHQYQKFENINENLFLTKNKIAARREAGSPMSETLGILVVCIILVYGGWMIFSGSGTMTGPFFVMFIGLFYQIINPLKSLSNAFYNMQKGSAALDRINILLQTPNAMKEQPNAKKITAFNERIEIKNVGFQYGEKEVLHEINITIPKGKTVALVGSSGAGKSTIADLVPRFHDVTSGEILVDDVNVKNLDLQSYRDLIGIVSQEAILFNDTIAENITLGSRVASQQDVEQAAKIANAHNFIIKKEEGYQTNVGDKGAKLSGGERQRITIARAVLKNPPILILDEATSALDTESEKLVQEAIANLMKNRTVLVIAHRLSTIQHADEIIVMSQGEIVERGTHLELLSIDDGYYKSLVSMQQL